MGVKNQFLFFVILNSDKKFEQATWSLPSKWILLLLLLFFFVVVVVITAFFSPPPPPFVVVCFISLHCLIKIGDHYFFGFDLILFQNANSFVVVVAAFSFFLFSTDN